MTNNSVEETEKHMLDKIPDNLRHLFIVLGIILFVMLCILLFIALVNSPTAIFLVN